MTLEEFTATLGHREPPADLSAALKALWYDGHGDWNAAHETAQDIDDETGALVHAYLHRKEGDLANAAYWYRRARKAVANDPLESEWTRIVSALL
jgi:hypothetical protein